jgi:hypothetical protein
MGSTRASMIRGTIRRAIGVRTMEGSVCATDAQGDEGVER